MTGFAGSLFTIAILFYAVSSPGQNIGPQKIWQVMVNSSLLLFFLYLLLSLIGIGLRALRYQILIKATGEENETTPGFKSMILITAVRGMLVDFLPARLGELVYVGLLKKFCGTKVTSGLTSLLFAILLDIIVLAPVAIIIGLSIGFPNKTPMLIALVALVTVIAFYICIRYISPVFVNILSHHFAGGTSLVARLVGFVKKIDDAMQTTIKAGVFTKLLIISFGVRTLKYAGLMILFIAVTKSNYPNIAALPDLKVLAALIASEISAALPIPTLMSFGAWELGGMTFLALSGANPQDALVSLITVHIQTQAVDYGIGITALFLLFFEKNNTVPSATSTAELKVTTSWQRMPLTVIAFVTVSVITALASGIYLNKKQKNSNVEGNLPNMMKHSQVRPQWFKQLKGNVVWSSNRSGNHDIFMMTLPDQTITVVSDHPNTETHPRISPDGLNIIFSRSHSPWQSWRDPTPWDVWKKNLVTGEETKLVEFGYSASWSEDGSSVYFQRGIGEIWQLNLTNHQETRLFLHHENGMPPGELYYPSLSYDGRLAITYRDSGRPTNIITDATGNNRNCCPRLHVDVVTRQQFCYFCII